MGLGSTPSHSQVPDLLFLFGLAGAGKTFCGTLLAERLGYYCYDLDVDCTPAMRQAIVERRPFTDAMRDEFFAIVCERVRELQAKYSKIIVMQAAYKQRHRDLVTGQFPALEMIWIDAPDALICERLEARGDAVNADYATTIRSNFEAPSVGRRLVNDVVDPNEIWARFQALFGA
jgi:gluconate kinase